MTAFLYILSTEGTGTRIAKIGVTHSLANRLTSISTCSPFRLVLTHLIKFPSRCTADAEEARLLVAAKRFRPEGEWVVHDEMLERVIAEIRGGESAIHEFRYRGRKFSVSEGTDALARARNPRIGLSERRTINRMIADGYGYEDIAAAVSLPASIIKPLVIPRALARGKQEAAA